MNVGADEDETHQLQAERLMIDEVKKRPFLWNESLPEHKSLVKSKTAWDSVGRLFGISGTKAKSRWKSMRDIYVRSLRRMALKSGRGTPKWKHFEAMNFLADHIKHRRSDLQNNSYGESAHLISNDTRQEGKQGAFNQLQSSDDDDDLLGVANEESITATATPTTTKRLTRGSRKRKRLSIKASNSMLQQHQQMTSGGSSNSGNRSVSNATSNNLLTVSATAVPVLSSIISPSDGGLISGRGTVGIGGGGVEARTHHGQHQHHHLAMIGANLVPISSIGCGTRSLVSGGHDSTASFATMPMDEDADELFGRAIAATLKKMPARMKALSKLRIQQVLYELEESSSSAGGTTNADCGLTTNPRHQHHHTNTSSSTNIISNSK